MKFGLNFGASLHMTGFISVLTSGKVNLDLEDEFRPFGRMVFSFRFIYCCSKCHGDQIFVALPTTERLMFAFHAGFNSLLVHESSKSFLMHRSLLSRQCLGVHRSIKVLFSFIDLGSNGELASTHQ